MSDKESREILTALKIVPLHSYALATRLEPAYEIAHALGCTVYDSTYVALAIAESCPLITADRKLVNLLAQTPLAPTTVWIEDLA